MIKSLLLFCSVIICTSIAPREKFTYQEKPQLSWEDFKGTPPRNAQHAASVNSGMAYSFSANIIGSVIDLDIEVKSEFYPELSWKKDLLEDSDQLLRHEQLHWDISELHARILRKALNTYQPTKNYKKEILAIFKKVEKARQTMQKRYDKQTNHGLLLSQQREWETYISQEFFKLG